MPVINRQQDIDYLVSMAQTRLDKGVIHEPRGYFDRILLTIDDGTGLITPGNDDIFRNSEPYPVHITHATFGVDYYDQAGNVDAIRNIQLIGANFRMHGQFYMNPTQTLIPAWANKPVYSMDQVAFCTSAWRFDNGRWVDDNGGGSFVLSARDSLEVTIQIIGDSDFWPLQGRVTFTGYGLVSHRPYILTSVGDIDDRDQVLTLSTHDYRNDGSEPILITDMTTNVSSGTGQDADDQNNASATGDSRRLRVNVRQLGNGTNRAWFQGPLGPAAENAPALDYCPTSLLGITSGRSIVHEFPNPIIWEPGEGLSVSGQSINPSGTDQDSVLLVGVFGYILIA